MTEITIILDAIERGSASTEDLLPLVYELSEIDIVAGAAGSDDDLLALDEALKELETQAPAKAELVRLRYFAGLTEQEAAKALNISRATASRWWMYAKAWLFARIKEM